MTTSMPKSVLCYDLDKDLTSVRNFVFTRQNLKLELKTPTIHLILETL